MIQCPECKGAQEILFNCTDDEGDICPPHCAGHYDTCYYCNGKGEVEDEETKEKFLPEVWTKWGLIPQCRAGKHHHYSKDREGLCIRCGYDAIERVWRRLR